MEIKNIVTDTVVLRCVIGLFMPLSSKFRGVTKYLPPSEKTLLLYHWNAPPPLTIRVVS